MDKIKRVCLTLDDFSDEINALEVLDRFHNYFFNFKVTVFAIPTRCSPEFFEYVKKYFLYLEIAQHGYLHYVDEFGNSGYEKARHLIKKGKREDMVKGWKSPGWKTSKDTYKALKDLGYWVAVNTKKYREIEPPEGIKYYEHNCTFDGLKEFQGEELKIQGHIHEAAKDSVYRHFKVFEEVVDRDAEFLFASELLQVKE